MHSKTLKNVVGIFLIICCALLALTVTTQWRVWNFVAAAERGDMQVVRQYLDDGMPPDEPRSVPTARAIEVASSAGHCDMVNLLVDRGANPSYGLKTAIVSNRLVIIKLLVKRGANIKVWYRNGKKISPMKFATEHGNPEVVAFMRQAGAQ